MKKIIVFIMTLVLCTGIISGCGKKQEKNLEGSLNDIMTTVYDSANFSEDMRASMEYYTTITFTKEEGSAYLGNADLDYKEGLYSAPMMSAVAYECILLRMNEGADIEAAKKILNDNADPRKWICVEAESVKVESVGDVILFIMAGEDEAKAVTDAFLALKE